MYEDSGVEGLRALKIVDLAMECQGFSFEARDCLMYRVAMDLGHNAVELLTEALIMACGEPLPRTYGDCVKRFSMLYLDLNLASGEVVVKL